MSTRFTVDDAILREKGLSLKEALLLGAIALGDIRETANNLRDEKLIKYDGKQFKLTSKGKELIGFVVNGRVRGIAKEGRFDRTARKLTELYPKGMRSAGVQWCASRRQIMQALRKFDVIYDDDWTEEEVVEATRRYVESFGEDRTYMSTLKNFICKTTRYKDEDGNTAEENESKLACMLDEMKDAKEKEEEAIDILPEEGDGIQQDDGPTEKKGKGRKKPLYT